MSEWSGSNIDSSSDRLKNNQMALQKCNSYMLSRLLKPLLHTMQVSSTAGMAWHAKIGNLFDEEAHVFKALM